MTLSKPRLLAAIAAAAMVFTLFGANEQSGLTGPSLWQYGLWSFQTGGTKLERFLPKNQNTQRKLLNFENWISGGLRSFQKSEF